MFEQSLVGRAGGVRTPLTVLASSLGQLLLIALVIVAPLLSTTQIPAVVLWGTLTAPEVPPPPPPPCCTAETAPAKTPPRQFDRGKLSEPRQVPDQAALIVDTAPPPSLDSPPAIVGSIGSSYEAGYSAIRSIVDAAVRSAPPPPPPAEPTKPEPVKVQRVKVGGDVKPPALIHRVNPVYPTLATQTRTSGTVRLQCLIGLDGRVTGLKLMSGHPLLTRAAIEAVRQWRYRPTLLNGEPVEVLMNVDVNFRLAN